MVTGCRFRDYQVKCLFFLRASGLVPPRAEWFWFFFWYFNRLPERWWAMNAGQFSTPENPLHINCGGIVGTGNRKDAATWKM
jgi:hypothetical protein